MNPACQELGPWAYSTCTTTAHTCEGMSEDLAEALTPIIYSLFSLGALYTVDGALKLTDAGVRAVSHCVDLISKRRFQPGEDCESEGFIQRDSGKGRSVKKVESCTRWGSFMKVWNSIFKTGRAFCVASLCVATGIPLYKFIQTLETHCKSVAPSCPSYKADAIDSCEWANNWLIDVIKEIIKGKIQDS